jgi:hypothetical protein
MFARAQLGLESVLLMKYYWGDEIKKNVMGGECSMYGGEKRCIQGFGGGRLR